MKELLFSCKSEKNALENVLAFNQIRKCDENIIKYDEPIPCKGQLGLWNYDVDK